MIGPGSDKKEDDFFSIRFCFEMRPATRQNHQWINCPTQLNAVDRINIKVGHMNYERAQRKPLCSLLRLCAVIASTQPPPAVKEIVKG